MPDEMVFAFSEERRKVQNLHTSWVFPFAFRKISANGRKAEESALASRNKNLWGRAARNSHFKYHKFVSHLAQLKTSISVISKLNFPPPKFRLHSAKALKSFRVQLGITEVCRDVGLEVPSFSTGKLSFHDFAARKQNECLFQLMLPRDIYCRLAEAKRI